MTPKVLLIIESDPRGSHRPAEAVRIGAGVGTWKKVDVILYLRNQAVLALSEWCDEFVDEDNFMRYLPIFGEWKRPIYVQSGARALQELGEARLPYEEIDDDRLANLAAECNCVMRF
jgi:hypothetical protein